MLPDCNSNHYYLSLADFGELIFEHRPAYSAQPARPSLVGRTGEKAWKPGPFSFSKWVPSWHIVKN